MGEENKNETIASPTFFENKGEDNVNIDLGPIRKDIRDLKTTQNELKKEQNKNFLRMIEIIGIFSAILAFIIIDVNIIKSAESFLSAILLIVGLTCSLVIFLVMTHTFFGVNLSLTKKESDDKFNKIRDYLIFSVSVLSALVVVGMVTYFLGWELFKNKQENKNHNSLINIGVELKN